MRIQGENVNQRQVVRRERLNYSEEEKQLEEYYKIAKDFDGIVNRFSEIISQKSRYNVLSQREV